MNTTSARLLSVQDVAAGDQPAQERQPAGPVLGGGDVQAEDLPVAVGVDAGGEQGVLASDQQGSGLRLRPALAGRPQATQARTQRRRPAASGQTGGNPQVATAARMESASSHRVGSRGLGPCARSRGPSRQPEQLAPRRAKGLLVARAPLGVAAVTRTQ